ncbi:MAG TPA: aspartyl/asparaginyl beta-hydroxylase domain-containing protein [Rhizomicrobium sp.]|nr:aspartyl/asparaginyl beta-hydroxylase domain-containing protein [Rhizomicrobium sp.]
MTLPDRLRLPFAFDGAQLARDLDGLSASDWIGHFLTDRYDGNWDVIPLRGPKGVTHPVMMISAAPGAREFADTPMLQACPYFRAVIAAFACEILGARLLRLTPGSRINQHTDHEYPERDGIQRIHIPVVTNPDVEFLLNGSRVTMEAGSAWYLRLSDPHSVANNGQSDRVHLIVDTVLNDWMRALLARTASSEPVTA